eukprot:6631665-Alexandrium_andersonii.AAC.1
MRGRQGPSLPPGSRRGANARGPRPDAHGYGAGGIVARARTKGLPRGRPPAPTEDARAARAVCWGAWFCHPAPLVGGRA